MATKTYQFGLEAARTIEKETGVPWERVAETLTAPPRPSVNFVRVCAWAAQQHKSKPPSRIDVDAGIDSFNRGVVTAELMKAIDVNTVGVEREAEEAAIAQAELDRVAALEAQRVAEEAEQAAQAEAAPQEETTNGAGNG